MVRDRSAALAAAALLALGATAAGCGGSKGSAKPVGAPPSASSNPRPAPAPASNPAPPTAAELRARLLTAADLPGGGFVADDDTADANGVMSSTEPACTPMTDLMNSQGHPAGAVASADASFTRSEFGPTIATGLAGFATPEAAQRLLASVTTAMRSCTKITETDKDGSTYDYLVAPLPFPQTGDASAAISVTADVEDLSAQVDLVLVRVGNTLLYVADTGFGSTDTELTQQVVTRAVAKAEGGSAKPRSAGEPGSSPESPAAV